MNNEVSIINMPKIKCNPKGKLWKQCPKCKQTIWVEYTGAEYYHKSPCRKSANPLQVEREQRLKTWSGSKHAKS